MTYEFITGKQSWKDTSEIVPINETFPKNLNNTKTRELQYIQQEKHVKIQYIPH